MAKRSNTFRLSGLTPFSWFYKLMNRRSRGNRAQKAHNSKGKSQISTSEPLKSPTIQHYTSNRFSYYIPSKERAEEQLPLCPSHPRKSKKKPETPPSSSSVSNSLPAPGTSLRRPDDSFDTEFIAEHNLPLPPPPILTKPRLINGRKQSQKQGSVRSPSGTQPIKLKIKSPKLVLKRVARRKGLSESFVVVKSSSDPKEDFRESMVDMIVENSLFSWKELEELLACYLLLNSSEYHDLIVEVFEKIWFDIAEIAM